MDDDVVMSSHSLVSIVGAGYIVTKRGARPISRV